MIKAVTEKNFGGERGGPTFKKKYKY